VATADNIPDCKLGVAPVNVDRQVADTDQRFIAPKGMEVRMEFRKSGDNDLSYIVCRLKEDVVSYAFAPGHAWDKPSGNNFTSNDEKRWPIPYTMPESKLVASGVNQTQTVNVTVPLEGLAAAMDKVAAAIVAEKENDTVPFQWNRPVVVIVVVAIVVTVLVIALDAERGGKKGDGNTI